GHRAARGVVGDVHAQPPQDLAGGGSLGGGNLDLVAIPAPHGHAAQPIVDVKVLDVVGGTDPFLLPHLVGARSQGQKDERAQEQRSRMMPTVRLRSRCAAETANPDSARPTHQGARSATRILSCAGPLAPSHNGSSSLAPAAPWLMASRRNSSWRR